MLQSSGFIPTDYQSVGNFIFIGSRRVVGGNRMT